jgi:protein-disulfide isomerase
MTLPLALAGGSFIFLAFLVVFFAAIVFGYYSQTGTEITRRPFKDRGDSNPLQFRDESQQVANWSHGTGGAHRRNRAPAAEIRAELDPDVRARLRSWREHLSKGLTPGLVGEVDPARDHVRGPQDAPVTIVAYGDFQCGACRTAEEAVRTLQAEDPDGVRYVYRHFPVADAHEAALPAAEVAELAATHDAFWEFHDATYRAKRAPSRETLVQVAGKLGIDAPEVDATLDEHRYADRIAEDFDTGVRSGVDGTPTLFVNGVRHDDDMDAATLRTAVSAAAAVA